MQICKPMQGWTERNLIILFLKGGSSFLIISLQLSLVSIVLKNAVLKDIERLAKASKVGILDGYEEVVADNGGVVS